MTGIPIQNVNNNCATGSSALYLGCKLVESGAADCVLAVGFEKMQPGSLGLIVSLQDTVVLINHFLSSFRTCTMP
jgi:acetyl-CoA acetyltransferase